MSHALHIAAVALASAVSSVGVAKGLGFGSLSADEVSALLPEIRMDLANASGRCAAARATGKDKFRGPVAMDAPSCQTDQLLPALKFVYDRPVESGAFLDVGAHTGHWTAEVLTTFGRLEYRKFAKEFPNEEDRCPSPEGHTVTVYCFEPLQANFDRLKDRAKRSAWQLEDVQLMRAAVANVTGKVQVWAAPGRPDPEASLSPTDGVHATTEKAVTIDLIVKKSLSVGKAFLLRLSTNGHERGALMGAKKSLKQRLVRFVLFDVSPLWESAGHRLRDAVSLLWRLGYACFALLPRPAPLSGPFWQQEAVDAGPAWFSVFCGVLEDPGLRRVLRILDPDAPDYVGVAA